MNDKKSGGYFMKKIIVSLLFLTLGLGTEAAMRQSPAPDEIIAEMMQNNPDLSDREISQRLQDMGFAPLSGRNSPTRRKSPPHSPKAPHSPKEARAAMTRMGDSFLVIGVSEKEKDHPLLKAHNLPKNVYFLDRQTLPNDGSSHFIHADFDSSDFQKLAAQYPEAFTNIYFDFSTLKFLYAKNEKTTFSTLFRMLKKGGRLYLPDPGPGIIGLMLPLPEGMSEYQASLDRDYRERNRKSVTDHYFNNLIANLEASGFLIKFEDNKAIHGDPVFEGIRENTLDKGKYMKPDTIKDFQVLIAKK